MLAQLSATVWSRAIDAVAEVDPNVAPSRTDTSPGAPPAPVMPGAYVPDIIVLLTDGASNTGPAPVDAAKQAVDRGLRVYTIGFGTAQGHDRQLLETGHEGAHLVGLHTAQRVDVDDMRPIPDLDRHRAG